MRSRFRFPFIFAIISILLAAAANAQKAEDVLAAAKSRTFTAANLSPDGQKAFLNQKTAIANARANLFSQMVTEMLLDLEAKASNSTRAKLLADLKAKISDPSAVQIQAVYDANQATLRGKPLADVKKDIVAFLRRAPEQKALDAYVRSLQTKYKFAPSKDVNAADLKPFDSLAAIGAKQISTQEFEAKYRVALNDFFHQQYDDIRSELEIVILNALIEDEAKARNTDSGSIIAAEITDKMTTYADGEREALEAALMKRLFTKYEVKLLLKEPPVIAQNISVDDDPSRGLATAPVTVVMFSDFECPACSRTHPVLTKVMAEYNDKVRFVVRDYPLENIHENAFLAAMAASAANAQGKFFEYTEILYKNQTALDRESLKKYAAETGLNVKQFELDLASEKAEAEIRKDRADGDAYGVSSTPAIFINGVKVHRLSAEAFRKAIDRALQK
jgi:protein-disulfide isomerase